MRDRERRAADVVVGCLPDAGLSGSVWVAGDTTGEIARAVADEDLKVLPWHRHHGAGSVRGEARAWPGDESGDAAILRLPKGREALEMAVHALLARVREGGPLLVYGANDEGIRSTGKTLATWLDDVQTLEARGHCRVWIGRARGAATRGALDDWATTVEARLPSGDARWTSFPGLFAHGQLDPATALLLEALPDPKDGERLLDFGCGAGVIGLDLSRRGGAIELHALDRDALALEATARNVPQATLHGGDGLGAVPHELAFDAIVSNPPIHQGRDLDRTVVQALCEGAARRLRPGGSVWLVVQRTVPVARWLEPAFSSVEARSETRSFVVWRATRPRKSRTDRGPESRPRRR